MKLAENLGKKAVELRGTEESWKFLKSLVRFLPNGVGLHCKCFYTFKMF